jgi:diketogulonate reductase-like aldo/keto reductase
MQEMMTMNNGVSIPSIGIGTWQIWDEEECKQTIESAIAYNKYTHIDTASIYRNEKFIGESLINISKEIATIDIDSIFITSKVPPTKTQNYDSIISCFEQSCRDLQRSTIDLYLIHWPGTSKIKTNNIKNEELRLQTWYALERLYKDKRVKAIGVSNFMPQHLNDTFFNSASIIPMLNSIEYHPLIWNCEEYQQLEQICSEKNILIQAYSPLAQGEIFKEHHLNKLSQSLSSDNNVLSKKLLQWCLMKNKCIIPKSTNPSHIKANISVLKDPPLSDQEVQELDDLFCKKRVCWDPTIIR